MAKQLNVNLSFNVDTREAKAQIQALSKSLQDIAKMPGNASNLFDDTQIKQASQAALELQQHLSKAVNVDTGKLDLSRFSSSLKTSNKDLSIYCDTLLSTGEKGQQAFLQLAQAIATADTPVTRINKKLAEMGTTLKNTARWQISSSILHGFMGAVQSAYGYAQDLNESLNEIRIVTGQNIEQMSKFAAEANRAAKALSTTTTEYTDASLIYYQQGLSDSEVAKRTEVTIKMANAAGQSAKIVSDQLTAVWNNFYDGSKSLEYYADVMTALGAATASSTDEIAGGLEKFAAIGETIGLSYEYAASALATITSNTRQSEEVVGTALKTIFARIQGLNLGETLDDGVTLNKYSEALQKVGISVFDASGQLKDMDNILDEMAAKWETLGRAEQTALAQTVAGVRQYTQLVALMENWDNGDNDSMTANLNTSYNSSGALQEQADIYAESWEAAQDRVTAAAEHIYSSLINDEFFIDLLNGFEKVLETIGGLIDGLGGLKGVVSVVGSVFLTSFAKQVPEALTNLRQNLMVFTGQSKKVMQEVQSELNIKLAEQQANPALSESYKIQLEGISKVNAMKQKLVLASKSLSAQEREEYEAKIKNVQEMYKEAAALAEKKKAAEELAAATEKAASEGATQSSMGVFKDFTSQMEKEKILQGKIDKEKEADPDKQDADKINRYTQALEAARQKATELEVQIEQIKKVYNLDDIDVDNLINNNNQEELVKIQERIATKVKETTAAFTEQTKKRSNLENISTSVKSQAKAWEDVAKAIKKAQAEGNTKNLSKHVDETKRKMEQYLEVLQKIAQENGIALSEDEINGMRDAINDMNIDNIEDVTQGFSTFAQTISNVADTEINALDDSIAELHDDMLSMQFNESEITEMGNAAQEAADAGQRLSDTMDNIGGAANENAEGTFEMSTALTDFASTAMSVSALISSIQSAIDVFKDDGATAFEKMGAAISVLIPLMSTYNSIQALATTLKKSDTVTALLQTASTKLKTVADKGETAGIWAKVAAYIAEQIAAWPVLVITLALVAAFAALAAIVTVVVTVVNAITEAYNKDAIAAEKAEASAQALSEAYNEAKQSYEDMIAAMDEYKSAREALDSLTEGTQEYQDALEKANRAALELINNNPDLFKEGDYHWENGELIIDDEAMTQAQQKASARESQAYAAMQMGQAEAKEARNTANETALRRELVNDSMTGTDYLVGVIGTAIGGALATLGGPLGMALGGALIGANGIAMSGALESKKLEDSGALSKTLEQLQKDNSFLNRDTEQIKATLNIDDDDIINALIENKDALLELSQAQEAQAQQEKLAAQQSAMEIMQSQGIDNADEMAYLGGAVFQKANEEAYEQYLKTMSSKGGLQAGAEAYFSSQGISSKNGFKIENYDTKNGTVKYSYLDADGQRQEMEVTAEQIAMTQAVIDAEAELVNKCNTISNAFDTLDADIQQVGSSTAVLSEGMKAFLSSGDTSQLTKEQYDAMAGMNDEEMKNYLASIGINDSTVQDFGYNDISGLIADMDLTNTGDKWSQYQNITAHQGTEDLTLNQVENINNALKQISDFFGEEVGHEMLDLSAAMADSLDEAAKDDFWEQLGNISDYADADQWDAFLEAMKESEDMTDDQIKALEDYVDTAKLAARATKDLNFDEMAESVRGLRDIMENISEGEREITDDEFATLEAQGIDTSKFAKTIDGYRYLGDSADLVADISAGITQKFKDAEQNFINIAATAQQASQNLIEAEAALEAAKIAGDATRASAEVGAQNQMSNTQKLSIIMNNIVTNVVSKIKTAWDWICGIMMEVYQFFVNTFNTIGQGITDIWNGFLQAISDIINGSIGGIMEWIEETFDIDTGWDDIKFEKAEFTAAKTSEEILAEENAKKAEQDLIAATDDLATAIPDMTASIESSADYLSEAELDASRRQAEQNYNTAQSDYEAAVATYGADSTQAKYYEQLVAYYEAQMEAYAKALDSKAWGEVIAEGIDTKEMESYVDLLEQAHPEMRKLYESTEDYENALLQVATANKKMEKGVKSLSSNWDDWNDIMSDSEASASDIATILPDVNDALQDVLNLDAAEFALLPPDFARKHWDLIQDVVNGVEGSVDTLRDMAGQEILMQIDGVLDPDGNLDAQFLALHEKIASFDQSQFTVGVAIDPESNAEFIAACNDIIQKAGMTAEQAQAYFASMGYDIKLKPVKQQISETQWSHIYRNIYDEKGNPAGRIIERAWPTTFTGEVDALAIETITPNGSYGGGIGVETTAPKTSRNTSSSSGGGGGSSKESDPQKADEVKKTDVVDRYKQIEDKLDDVRDAADEAAEAMDRLYGKNRIKKMQEQNALLQEEIDLLEKKKAEAINYLTEDKAALQEAAAEAGISFSFDENGNIRNYETQMTALYNLLDAAIQSANADGDATDEEQEAIDAIQEKIDAVKDAIAQYDETRELITDLDQEAQEKFNEWQDNNFEILNYTLELKLEVNDDNLQRLEYYIGKLEDDFYQMAESAALMVGNDGQWDQYTQNIEDYRAYLAKLKEDYEAGRISEDAYVEGVKEVKDGIYENLESLNELDKTMMEYYGETLAAAGEEIAKYTDLMEHQTSVLEHYNSVMELLNKQNDYAAMGVILEAQATLAENAVKVSQANYEMYAAEVAEREAALRAAQSRGASQAEIELLEQEWWAAQEAASEAQDQMISDVEAWAEAINAVLDNKLGSLAQALENSLTGDYGSFNEMTSAMERANSLQEEYLTTTNKVYETNKLMRTAQQEIDKTTNSLAKTRLKQFINETQQLQDQTELSQYELEIQQAKYDLLLAEIALEEAQAAKSTVRLQRDSEGNFGYVYTADESQIADAQQKLEDAQNSLYNIALEGANNYSQKYAETLREMNDTLIEINEAYRNGEYENEQEYQDALMAAREYYYEKMKQYSELYQVAIVTDGRVVEEAWSSEFANMTMETEQWMWAVDEYIANVRDAFSLWEEQMDRIADLTVGPDLDSLKEKVSGVVDVNTELADSITQDVIPGIQAEIDAVKKITSAYSLAREARLRYIRAGEQVANTAAQDLGEYIDNFDWSNTSGGSSSGNNSGNGDSGSNTGNEGSASGSNGSGNESSSESGPLTWDRIMSAYNQIVSGAWGNGVANRIKRGVAAGYTEEEVRAAQKYINYTFPKNQNGYGYSKAKAKELLGFDTGGYTGDWAGSYGKLALLHKKELILEPGDTENFLDAMNILDRIVQMIDLQAMSSQFGGIMSAPGMSNMNNGVLEQMVHIEAHFEGATDRYEIEAAFDNLINRASQQANQK